MIDHAGNLSRIEKTLSRFRTPINALRGLFVNSLQGNNFTNPQPPPHLPRILLHQISEVMADEVKIDKDLFQNRLSHFISTWKNDRRQSSDALFGGVGSIVVLMGRNEDNPTFHKNNAMHVGWAK